MSNVIKGIIGIMAISSIFFGINGQIIVEDTSHTEKHVEKKKNEEPGKRKYEVFTKQLLNNKEYLKKLNSPLSKISATKLYTRDEIKDCIWHLESLGFNTESIFIGDTIILNIIIHSLPELGHLIIRSLISNSPPDYLAKKSDFIKPVLFAALDNARNKDPILYLLCLLDLTEKEKEKILSVKSLDDKYRARLGDKKLEKKYIKLFEKADSYREKREYAEILGYVGTSDCAKMLLKSFDSDMVDNDGEKSIRLPIMKALAHIHPDNNLFTDIRVIEGRGESGYLLDLKRESMSKREQLVFIKSFSKKDLDYSIITIRLEKIIQWAKKTYDITIQGEFKSPYIRETFK